MDGKRIPLTSATHIASQVTEFLKVIEYRHVIDCACREGSLCACFPPEKYLGMDKDDKLLSKARDAFSEYSFQAFTAQPQYADLYFAHNMLSHTGHSEWNVLLQGARCKYFLLLEQGNWKLCQSSIEKAYPLFRSHDFILEGKHEGDGIVLCLLKKVIANRK